MCYNVYLKMNHKPLISIIIPTYNRAHFLERLLNHIAPQAAKFGEVVQLCVSNNCSTDKTREIVASFQKKYPGLLHYGENSGNVGIDRNILKVMGMAEGEFVWLLGDDDIIVDDGVKKLIDFINAYCDNNTGLIILGKEPSFAGWKTGEEMAYSSSREKSNPEMYTISRKDVIGLNFPNKGFASVLLFNNDFLKKVLTEEKEIIQKAMGNYYIHVFLHRLMFLKYPQLQALRFLRDMLLIGELHYYKFYLEDRFKLSYAGPRNLNDLLLSSKYMTDDYKEIMVNLKRGGTKYFIIEMGLMKGFKVLRYVSFWGCINMFFQNAPPAAAVLFSIFFIVFLMTPSVFLRNLYKVFVRIRHKDWQETWSAAVATYAAMSKGSQRQAY